MARSRWLDKINSAVESRNIDSIKHAFSKAPYKAEQAKANLMEETRLGQKAKTQQAQDHTILNDEEHLGRTQDSLSKLGAGQSYGA